MLYPFALSLFLLTQTHWPTVFARPKGEHRNIVLPGESKFTGGNRIDAVPPLFTRRNPAAMESDQENHQIAVRQFSAASLHGWVRHCRKVFHHYWRPLHIENG